MNDVEKQAQDVLVIMRGLLDEGKEDVGILVEKFDTETITVVDSYSNDILSIPKEVLIWLSSSNYLKYPVNTKIGVRWFYEFTNETRNGFSLYDIMNIDEYLFLKGKKFYVVPRGKKTVYYAENEEYSFTKIKDNATKYDLDSFFKAYCNRQNPFMYKTFYRSQYTAGWNRATHYITVQNSDYVVEEKSGKILYREKYAKDFDIIIEDTKQVYQLNFCFDVKDRILGGLEIDLSKIETEIRNDKNNFYVTFYLGYSGGSLFSIGTLNKKVKYIQFVNKPLFNIREN